MFAASNLQGSDQKNCQTQLNFCDHFYLEFCTDTEALAEPLCFKFDNRVSVIKFKVENTS